MFLRFFTLPNVFRKPQRRFVECLLTQGSLQLPMTPQPFKTLERYIGMLRRGRRSLPAWNERVIFRGKAKTSLFEEEACSGTRSLTPRTPERGRGDLTVLHNTIKNRGCTFKGGVARTLLRSSLSFCFLTTCTCRQWHFQETRPGIL